LLDVQRELILAQISLQELEDTREELEHRLSESRELQTAAQQLADRATADFDHLDRVHRELLAHRDHLQHVQHVTHQALEQTRADLAARDAQLAGTRQELAAAHDAQQRATALGAQLTTELRSAREEAQRLHQHLAELTALAEQRATRIQQLESEVRTMKASRSWRWTAWLRSIERALRRRQG
jgi:chromosome segregation ATPase